MLIKNINDRVEKNDTLWILGDFGFGETAKKTGYLEDVFDRLNGEKHLVIGNHDGARVFNLPWKSQQEIINIKDKK